MPPAIVAAIVGLLFQLNSKAPKVDRVYKVGQADYNAFLVAQADFKDLPEKPIQSSWKGKI